MDDYIDVLTYALKDISINTKVCVNGTIIKKIKPNRDKLIIYISDITGTALVSIEKVRVGESISLLKVNERVKIYGSTIKDANNDKTIISNVDKIESCYELPDEGNIDLPEQEARLFTSKISNHIRNELVKRDFQEISTRVISRSMDEDILEPLLVKFPGFGTEAFLSPSPSSQLTEFLTATNLPNVFTSTLSFTGSYRFKNCPTELPIIMVKAINMSLDEEKEIINTITENILDELLIQKVDIDYISDKWTETIDDDRIHMDKYTYGTYSASIPVIGQKWNSLVETIIRLTDPEGNVLVEGTREVISEEATISTFSFYPTQYLNIAQKAPRRILQNLWNTFNGGKIYEQ